MGADRSLPHPGFGVVKVCQFNRAWLDYLAPRPLTYCFSYEDIKWHPRETLSEVLDFCDADAADVDSLLEQSRFSKMCKVEQGGDAHHLRLGQRDRNDPESAKVRRGKVFGYRDYLDDDMIEFFRNECRKYGFEA